MSQRARAFIRWLPFVWAALVTAALAVPFFRIPWAFIDVYNNLSGAAARSWGETLEYAFSRGVEYRPLLTILVKAAHQLAGLRLWAYQLLVILQFAAILGLLLWMFKPTTTRRAIAACIAIAVVAGLHSSRVLFMFAPLNAHSLGVVFLLAAAALAIEPRARRLEWLLLPLTLTALLLLESGLLIIPVVFVVWLLKVWVSAKSTADDEEYAPPITWRGVTASIAALVIYLSVRFALGTLDTGAAYTETGLGFEQLDREQLSDIFARAPWMLWAYNAIASLLTVVASEPRAGRFILIDKLLQAETPLWLSIHVWSSLLTSAVIVWALTKARTFAPRDRYLTAIGVTVLLGGSALGFLYTRDRIAISAGVGYAMLAYVGIGVLLERVSGRPEGRPLHENDAGPPLRWQASRRALGTAIVVLIAAGWLVRTGEAFFQLRDSAWENYVEWTDRYEALGGARPQTDILLMLREAAVARRPDDPRRDPDWTYTWFEREFER